MTTSRTVLRWLLLGAAMAAALLGCPAVYPEIGTRSRPAPTGISLDPPPPEELRWVRFVSGEVPPKTRDGRSWGQSGSMPDPYARLLVNGKEVLRTPVQSDTLEPTWPDGPRGNFVLRPEDKLRVELWDRDPLDDQPIGLKELGRLTPENLNSGALHIELEGGGRLVLAIEPARAVIGLGMWFELRTESVYVTRLLENGPAARAGLRRGDEVVRIGARTARSMSSGEIRSAFNSVPVTGLPVVLRHADGTSLEVTLKDGPIYPRHDVYGNLE